MKLKCSGGPADGVEFDCAASRMSVACEAGTLRIRLYDGGLHAERYQNAIYKRIEDSFVFEGFDNHFGAGTLVFERKDTLKAYYCDRVVFMKLGEAVSLTEDEYQELMRNLAAAGAPA